MAKKAETKSADIKAVNAMFGIKLNLGYVKTGIPIFDMLVSGEEVYRKEKLNKMGLPKGKFTCFSAKNATGKSTLALEIAKFVCASNPKSRVLFIDHEQGLNEKSILSYGVQDYMKFDADGEIVYDESQFMPISPKTYTKTLNGLDHWLGKYGKDIVFIVDDSLRSTFPDGMEHEDINTLPMAMQAKCESWYLPMYKECIETSGPAVLFLNQYRNKRNPMSGQFYETEAGGTAFAHWMDVRIVGKPAEQIKYNTSVNGEMQEEVIGHYINIAVKKSRYGNQFKTINLPIKYGKGVSKLILYRDALMASGVMDMKSSWVSIDLPEIGVSDKKNGMQAFEEGVLIPNFAKIEDYIIGNNLISLGYDRNLEAITKMEEEQEGMTGPHTEQSIAGVNKNLKVKLED